MAAPQLSKKKFWIVKPKAGRNYIKNPRFDTPEGVTGWASGTAGVVVALSGDEARRGAYSMKITPPNNTASPVGYDNLSVVNRLSYTFSFDIKGTAGQSFSAAIHDASWDSKKITSFTTTGYWQRIELTFTATENSSAYKVSITRNAIASTDPFYVDGVQFEQTDKATTFISGYEGDGYSWEGASRNSASLRAMDCKTGGELLDLEDYCQLVQVTGLGHGDWNQILTKMTSGGDLYQGHIRKSRQFSLIVDFIGDTLGEIEANRKAIIDAIRPDLFEGEMVVRYQGFDDNGYEATNPIDIICIPLPATLTDTPDLPNHQRAVLNFEIPSGLLDGAYEEGGELDLYAEFAADYIVRRDPTGKWFKWTGSSYVNPLDGVKDAVYDIKEAPNGDIYVGGYFWNVADIPNTYLIVRWSKANQTWESLGVFGHEGSGESVKCMAFDANGELYVGGYFYEIAGVPNANRIAKYNVATGTWSSLGTGLNGYVTSIVISPEGTVYIGGTFTSAGGNTNCNYIAYFDKTANDWRPLATGLNGKVETLKFAPDGRLLIGGWFTNATGTNGNYICWWDGSAFKSFKDLGATEINKRVMSIDINPSGTIIIGGDFTDAGGDPKADGVAAWRGNNWGSLLAGGVYGGPSLYRVYRVYCLSNGDIYVSGVFEYAGNLKVDRLVKSVGGVWQRVDIDLPDALVPVMSLLELSDGTLYLGGEFATTGLGHTGELAVAAGAVDINVSSGSANTYPYIEVIGPGTLYSITNYSTGAQIAFNDLTLLQGEVISFNFDPLNLKFTSSWDGRGSVLRYVNAGSDYGNFYLKPGVNSISVFMDKATTTSATKAWIAWKPQFWGIDGALLETTSATKAWITWKPKFWGIDGALLE